MYTLTLKSRARSDIRRLHPTIRARVLEKLEKLCANWDEHPKKALKGIHRGKFSLTVAKDYRVLYSFKASTQEVFVHEVGHRSDVY
jgi:mRNA-degrading endonuclease RelE of RelBE toxin-antitoxin system